ncbi:MAG: amidohydrolase [Candidatus Aminicenantes bacterium]|nr:amidohydrolase [Candidatus Aminicenantes bacterium]
MVKKGFKILVQLIIIFLYLIIGISFLASQACQRKVEPADLVLMNGQIVTLNEAQPQVEAIAVKGDRIISLGPNKSIRRYIGDKTQVIDLGGKLAIPGFIDSHGHFINLGESKMILDLTKAKSWEEIVAMVAEAAKNVKPGEWIVGRGWHQEKWLKTPEPNVAGLPFHHELSRVSPNNPVLLTHASGHSCLTNAKAMELAGIKPTTKDPEGGQIVRDSQGNPIGAFIETAQGLIRRAMSASLAQLTAEEREARLIRAIVMASQECLAKGVTSFHDAGTSWRTIEIYKKLADEGRLPVRLYVMLNESNEILKEKLSAYRLIGYADNHVTVRAIKRVFDGALGAHGAWLLEPYADLPTSVGLNTYPPEALRETARLAIENDFQLCVHAIGDRANQETLNIFEEAFKAFPEKKDLRWRIEHAQHLHPLDIPRFGQLRVIASMQGIHCTSDGPWVIKRLGEKRAEEGAYVWRKLLKSGAIICNGTDAPVEDVDPINCFYASVTRRLADGTLFYPEQKMTREEALRSYTLNGAYASFQENLLGSLEAGKLADITVLSQNIMTIPEEEIPKTQVVMTIVGGKILYQR